jgi:hypothetical protein
MSLGRPARDNSPPRSGIVRRRARPAACSFYCRDEHLHLADGQCARQPKAVAQGLDFAARVNKEIGLGATGERRPRELCSSRTSTRSSFGGAVEGVAADQRRWLEPSPAGDRPANAHRALVNSGANGPRSSSEQRATLGKAPVVHPRCRRLSRPSFGRAAPQEFCEPDCRRRLNESPQRSSRAVSSDGMPPSRAARARSMQSATSRRNRPPREGCRERRAPPSDPPCPRGVHDSGPGRRPPPGVRTDRLPLGGG